MNLEELKKLILDKVPPSEGIIFQDDLGVISKQYINEIASILGRTICYVKTLEELRPSNSIFGDITKDLIKVCIIDSVDHPIVLDNYCYVVCKKSSQNCMVIPKLQKWQIIDYINTVLEDTLDPSQVENLYSACNGDLIWLESEIDKIRLMEKPHRKLFYELLLESGQIPTGESKTIFDFTNALLEGDVLTLSEIYSKLDRYDIEPLGVVTIIYTQLRKLIMVGFNKNPTEQNTGILEKQIYAIKKSLYKYNSKKIIEGFQAICEAEKLLKEGTLSNKELLDYVVVTLL